MREGADRLLKLLGDISEELVEEAAEEEQAAQAIEGEQAAQAGEETDKTCAGMEKPGAQGKAPRKKKKPWLALGRLVAAAACLCLVLGVARLLGQGLGKTGQMDEEAAMDMAESTAAGAEAGEGAAALEEAVSRVIDAGYGTEDLHLPGRKAVGTQKMGELVERELEGKR